MVLIFIPTVAQFVRGLDSKCYFLQNLENNLFHSKHTSEFSDSLALPPRYHSQYSLPGILNGNCSSFSVPETLVLLASSRNDIPKFGSRFSITYFKFKLLEEDLYIKHLKSNFLCLSVTWLGIVKSLEN